MRILVEITALGLLLFLGWERPFKRWVEHPAPAATPLPAPARTNIAPVEPTPKIGNWMWNEQRKTPLDRGAYNRDENVARAPELYSRPGSNNGVDANGRRFWVDQAGARHYY